MVYLHADREQILSDAVGSLQRFVDGKAELQQLLSEFYSGAGGAAVFMELRDSTGGVRPAVGDQEGQESLKQGNDSDHAGEELRRVGRDNEGVVGQ